MSLYGHCRQRVPGTSKRNARRETRTRASLCTEAGPTCHCMQRVPGTRKRRASPTPTERTKGRGSTPGHPGEGALASGAGAAAAPAAEAETERRGLAPLGPARWGRGRERGVRVVWRREGVRLRHAELAWRWRARGAERANASVGRALGFLPLLREGAPERGTPGAPATHPARAAAAMAEQLIAGTARFQFQFSKIPPCRLARRLKPPSFPRNFPPAPLPAHTALLTALAGRAKGPGLLERGSLGVLARCARESVWEGGGELARMD